ncbi:MAG: hypothetical protein ACRC6A_09115 [Fusobacteriaceae bacterium]
METVIIGIGLIIGIVGVLIIIIGILMCEILDMDTSVVPNIGFCVSGTGIIIMLTMIAYHIFLNAVLPWF